MIDLEIANQQLKNATPSKIIEWAVDQAKKPLTSTHFGPYEAVILHMITQIKPDMQIIWVDSGYNTRKTYQVAQQLIDSLRLNVDVFTPKVSAARQDAALGGIPGIEDEAVHTRFTQNFKLEPFARALQTYKPDIWLTAVRSEQTEFRQDMQVVSQGPEGIIKVAPLLHWKQDDMEQYLQRYQLPNIDKYFDPTKAIANRECGLHTQL